MPSLKSPGPSHARVYIQDFPQPAGLINGSHGYDKLMKLCSLEIRDFALKNSQIQAIIISSSTLIRFCAPCLEAVVWPERLRQSNQVPVETQIRQRMRFIVKKMKQLLACKFTLHGRWVEASNVRKTRLIMPSNRQVMCRIA